MKRLLISLLVLLYMALPMSAAVDGKFQYSYPDRKDLPYNLGYQYSLFDLKESSAGWRVMYLNEPVTLTYNITSEEDKTVEVVFDPSYLALKDVVIPEIVTDSVTGTEYTVTAIGKMAFDDCPEIRSVIMGDSITRIEDYAFNMCENKVLHNIGFVKFSKNLTHIGDYAFKNCHNLTTGRYTEGDQWPLQEVGFVENIDYPFYGYGGRVSGLENYLLLPASVEHIGKHAFEGCYFVNITQEKASREYGLSKVKIPNPSCVIDDYAFADCQFLELITIGEELTAKGLTNATIIPEKRGRIGDYAFANCNLMRLDIPASIESIGENAFINCFHRLRELTPRINTGRIYLDNLKWFYPKSLFDNYDSWWASWNNSTFDESFAKQALERTNNYLDSWHTNTVTIHSGQTSIGVNAFANNPLLEKVIIKGPAGEIGQGAFRNCTSLKSVELPDDLKKLSSSMFMNCSVLDTVKIPDIVAEIGDSAFYMCKKLENIELPSELKAVNPCTFYSCEMLNISELPGKVESVGNYAFYGCKNITSISIPDKVTKIGDYAFAECYLHEQMRVNDVVKVFTGLTKVTIGDGVTSIGAHAFDGCRHLGQIEFGNSVETIGDCAFMNCMSCPEEFHGSGDNKSYQPSEVILPNTLIAMGTGAFQGCSHLPGISLSKGITVIPDFAFAYCSSLSSVENYSEGISASETAFLGCYSLENFDDFLPDVENLKNGIIYNKEGTEVISALPNITSANIKEGVTTIRDGAFADCGALTSVEFPSTLKVIGPRAFANCGVLNELKSPSSELEGAMFPTALEEIGSRAFENCVSLSYAVLINVTMGELVYAGCTGIEIVEIYPDFIQDLQDNWFAGCINMVGIEVIGDNERYTSDYYGELLLDKEGTTLLRAPSGIYDLVLPESVTKIGDYAVSNCFNLGEVYIPETVTHIGAHAFENCVVLDEDGYAESGLSMIVFENPAVTIGEYAFNNCKNLNYVEWPEDAEYEKLGSIGAYAFNNCDILTPNTYRYCFNINDAAISTLEPYAFANFLGLREIELPATLETIGDHAFDGCENLASVVFPPELKKIGNSAFKSTSLTALDLTETTIEEIGDSAFMNCSKIMALKLPSGLKKINPYTFYKCFSGAQFDKKPEENFRLCVEIPESVESIGDYAFYGCAVNSNKFYQQLKGNYSNLYHYYFYGLQSVSIGENVKTIGAHAFDGCYHLVEVEMGNSVTSIGDYAFNDCFKQRFNGVREVVVLLYGTYEKELNSYPVLWELDEYTPQPISLPESLGSLGVGAFNGCAELPSINFPASLTAIPAMAFNGCKLFPKIELAEGITTIGDNAFGGCIGVKEIHVPASLETGNRTFVDCDSALTVYYYAEVPSTFDEAFFSPKVYSSKQSVVYTPNAELMDVKMLTPWALFHTIKAGDEELVHTEDVLEATNNLRFRVLSNKPHPYCEVARPDFGHTEDATFEIPEWVRNTDPDSPYVGELYKVIRIGNDAFENNQFLTGITIPESVYDIGQEAFNNCKNLASIDLPESITTIGERAFAYCHALTYFKFPSQVTRVNTEVLRDCRGLLTVEMHDNIEELCIGALMDCRHLRKFERSQNWNLKLIDDYALKNCIELEEINIPEGVEKIGKEAMFYCQKLLNVSLPTTLKELGENVFDDCERLTIIRVYTETPPTMIGERKLSEPHCKIYVQAKTLEDYKKLWQVHEHRIEPGIIMTTIPTRAQMPEYIPGNTYKLSAYMYLDGQSMTWSTSNGIVATALESHDGNVKLNGVGRSNIHVATNQKFYHDCTLDVYPQVADANWDGSFTIADAVNIANYAVLNRSVLNNWWTKRRDSFDGENFWYSFYKVGADVNGDGEISFADASATAKKVLEKDAENLAKAPSRGMSDDLVICPASSTTSEGYIIPVGMDNSTDYVALEANIRVPKGTMLKAVKAGSRAARHALSTRRIDERTMRIVLFDLNNSAFDFTGESLLELVVDGESVNVDDIEIYGIVASDEASNSHVLSTRVATRSSGLNTVSESRVEVKATADGLIIGNADGKTVTVYSINGYTLSSFVATGDSATVDLPAGLYIVDVSGQAFKIAVK